MSTYNFVVGHSVVVANLLLKFMAYLFCFSFVDQVDGFETILSCYFFVLTSVLPGDIGDGQVSGHGIVEG